MVDESTGRVPEDMDARVFDGFDESFCSSFGILRQGDMGACDDEVKPVECVVVKIKRAVGEDIDFISVEDGDMACEVLAGGFDFIALFLESFDAQSVRLGTASRVICDGDGVESSGDGVLNELVERESAIRGGGMGVKFGPDVFEFDQVRRFGQIDLAGVFADGGGDIWQIEFAVDVGLGCAGDGIEATALGRACAGLVVEQAVFIKREVVALGDLAEVYAVLFRASKVEDGGTPCVGLDDAQVDLDGAGRRLPFAPRALTDSETGRGFCRTLGEDFFEPGSNEESLSNGGGVGGGDEDVDIADGFAASAQRTGNLNLVGGR